MSRPNSSASKKPERIESFEDHVDTLFEELAFAVQWQRPSILLAFCESEHIRANVELALEKRLVEIGQALVRFTVNEKRFDIPQFLAKRTDRDRSVYSVTGLSQGGGEQGTNAYRALNIRREYFVDYSIRALFWLTKDEAKELSRTAPDFWVFRHRVVEFDAFPRRKRVVPSAAKSAGRDQESPSQSESLDEQIVMHESLLANLPEEEESVATLLDLLYKLAALYQKKGEHYESIKRLKQGIGLAQQLDGVDLLAQFWGFLGLVYLGLNNPKRAIRAYRKAIRLTPQDAERWSSLGYTYLVQGRTDAARSAFRKAIKFNPQDATPWAGLGQAYRMLDRTKDAIHAYRKAVQFAPQDTEHWNNLGSLYIETGQIQDALEACNKAAKLAPQNVLPWNNLGLIYRILGHFSDAIIAYQQSLALDPYNFAAHVSLVACYRLSGKVDLTKQQIKLARPIIKNESEYNKAIFESVCGNVTKAIDLLTIALKEKQIGVDWLYRETNLDFIRNDPRFKLLLEMGKPGSDQPDKVDQ
jgi:tetratricopeptide (TPR) repeat protein